MNVINDMYSNGGYGDISSDDLFYDGLEEWLKRKCCLNCKSKKITYKVKHGIACEKCKSTFNINTFDDISI